MFAVPCCCERSVDLKVFDKENNRKSFDLISPLTKESIQRTLSSKIRSQLKLNVNNARGQYSSYHSSPKSNICALDKCNKTVNDVEGKQVVIYSNVKMYFCSYSCWDKWLQQLNKPYLSQGNGKRKVRVLSNVNTNGKRND